MEGKGCGRRVNLDKDVFHDTKEHVGTIEDLIVTRGKGISDAIIGVGVFPGMDATMSPSVTISAKSETCASSFLVRAKKLSTRCRIQLCRLTVLFWGPVMLLQAYGRL